MSLTTFVPGTGQSSIGDAVVVPEYTQAQFTRGDYLNQLQEQQRAADEKERLAAQARQNALQKYTGGLFADKNFLTGTEYDPTISSGLVKAQKDIADYIKGDPNVSTADVQSMASQKLLPIQQLSEKVKLLNTGLTGMTTGLTKVPGIDVTALNRQAMLNATHNPDGKGGFTLKDPDDINMTPEAMQGYLNDVIDKTPEVASQTPDAVNWRAVYDDVKPASITGSYSEGLNGRDLKKSYSASLLPFQTIQTDASGQPVVDKTTGQPIVTVRSQDAPANTDGTPSGIKIADNDVFDHFTSDIRGRLYVADQFKKMNADRTKQGLDPIDPNSTPGDIVKKKIVFDALSSVPAPAIKTDYQNSNDKQWAEQQRNAQQQRMFNERYGDGGIKPPKENFVQGMGHVLANNPDYLTGDNQKVPFNFMGVELPNLKKTDAVNISTAMPGGLIYSNESKTSLNPDPSDPSQMIETKTKIPYYAVYYDRKSGNIMTQKDKDSKAVDVGDPVTWIKQVAPANGVTTKQAIQILKTLGIDNNAGDGPIVLKKPATSTPAASVTPKKKRSAADYGL